MEQRPELHVKEAPTPGWEVEKFFNTHPLHSELVCLSSWPDGSSHTKTPRLEGGVGGACVPRL